MNKNKSFMNFLYLLCLYIGENTILIIVDLWSVINLLYKMAKKSLQPFTNPIVEKINKKIEKIFLPITKKIKKFQARISNYQKLYPAYTRTGVGLYFRVLFEDLRQWLRHNPKWPNLLIKILTPILSITIMIFTINYVTNLSYAVKVIYNGKFVGNVQNEELFEAAQMKVEQRVLLENRKEIKAVPKYSIVITDKNNVVKENEKDKEKTTDELADKLVKLSTDKVSQAQGFYIDGEFFGAVESTEQIQTMLDNKITEFEKVTKATEQQTNNKSKKSSTKATTTSVEEKGTETDFLKNIEFKAALYPNSSIKKPDEIIKKIQSPEQQAKKLLQIKVVKILGYNQTIPYQVNKRVDYSMIKGSKAVVQEGQNGQGYVTAKVEYVDGVEIGRAITNNQVLVAPVTETIIEGGADPIFSNPFISANPSNTKIQWPVAGGEISRIEYLSGRQVRAVDIRAPRGTPVFAVLDGVVVTAARHPSYGNYVVVQHSDGYVSLYAHASAIYVKVGQVVKRGEQIMAVGSTGRSTGNHLHFEFTLNGNHIDPRLYWN